MNVCVHHQRIKRILYDVYVLININILKVVLPVVQPNSNCKASMKLRKGAFVNL